MGANIKVESNTAIIEGVERFTGAQVSSPDLRAGAALVLAGLAADGITIVEDIHYIERGYERFDEKLRSLGAEMEKVSDEREIQKVPPPCRLTSSQSRCIVGYMISKLNIVRSFSYSE